MTNGNIAFDEKNDWRRRCHRSLSFLYSTCLLGQHGCNFKEVVSLFDNRFRPLPIIKKSGTDYDGDKYCSLIRAASWAPVIVPGIRWSVKTRPPIHRPPDTAKPHQQTRLRLLKCLSRGASAIAKRTDKRLVLHDKNACRRRLRFHFGPRVGHPYYSCPIPKLRSPQLVPASDCDWRFRQQTEA
jgi:hypothetical protein